MTEITPGNSIDQTAANKDAFDGPSSGTLTVDNNAYVISEDGYGAVLTGAWTVTDEGEIAAYGSSGNAINITGNSLEPAIVVVGTTGDVFGSIGVYTDNSDTTSITNQGTITGTGSGVWLLGSATLHNSSLIQGGTYGVIEDSSLPITIVNSGTIIGGTYAVLGGSGDDVFTDYKKTGATTKSGIVDGTINLGLGDNIFDGGSHAEKVIDGGGHDTVNLGGGNDIYLAVPTSGSPGNGVINGGAGFDYYNAEDATSAVFIDLGTASYADLTPQSAVGDDIGVDTVKNFEQAKGGTNDDTLVGSSAANTFFGNDGADFIYGLGGADTLTGGAGADTFFFTKLSDSGTTAASRDTITDFTAGVDKIDLSAIDANTHASDDQAFTLTSNHGLDGFTHHAGELHYKYTSGGNTIISGDVNGDGKADFSIELHGHILLQATDFAL